MKTILFFIMVNIISCLTAQELKPNNHYNLAQKELIKRGYGMFIHFGLNTFAELEWSDGSIPVDTYNPTNLNCDQWVKVASEAGFRYVLLITKHHDGFCLWDSKYTDYDVMASPVKRDIVKEVSDACKKYGLQFAIYYSLWDRHEKSYKSKNFNDYITYMSNQLKELLTNYGSICEVWFDGGWDKPKSFNWELPEQYALIHKLQPGCLVGNNHHQTPFAGEDIQIFERDLPGENTAGLSGQDVSHLPLETCETMNGMWGYKITDQNYKSTKTLIHYLVKAAGKNANLLMNIGPQPDGELPAVAVQRLQEMGEWMKQYGETIYGTRGGVVAPHDWGVTTQKGNKLYVHILDLKDKALFLPLTDKKVKKAVVFKDQSPVRLTKTKAGVLLEFAEVPKDIDYVVELTID